MPARNPSRLVDMIPKQEKHIDVLKNAGIATQVTDMEKGEMYGKDLAKYMWLFTPDDWVGVYKTDVMGRCFTSNVFFSLINVASR